MLGGELPAQVLSEPQILAAEVSQGVHSHQLHVPIKLTLHVSKRSLHTFLTGTRKRIEIPPASRTRFGAHR